MQLLGASIENSQIKKTDRTSITMRFNKEHRKMNTFTAIIHQEDDLYVAECPEVGTAK
jgi:hypothetical protein